MRIPDFEERLRAITSIESNTLVIAGAGTGKTSLLAARLCYTLGVLVNRPSEADTDPVDRAVRNIVAMTFTDKAATEMRERVREVLRLWINPAEGAGRPDAELLYRARQHLLEHLDIPDRVLVDRLSRLQPRLSELRVSTIHSFCLGVLRRYPIEAGLSPRLRVDEGGEVMEQIFRRQWFLYLQWLTRGEGRRVQQTKRVLAILFRKYGLDLEAIEQAARVLLQAAIVHGLDHLRSEPDKEQAFDRAYFERLKRSGLWASFIEAAEEAADRARKAEVIRAYRTILEVFYRYGDELSRLRKALRMAFRRHHGLVDHAKKLVDTGPVTHCFRSYAPELPETRLDAFQSFFREWLFQVDHRLTRMLLIAVRPFLFKSWRLYRREGVLTFDEMLYRTLHLLDRHPAVRRRLMGEIAFILVDEFQDTNRIQIEMLRRLATDEKTGRWLPGRLFVVGDPKQSIYAFRDADLAAYQSFFRELKDEAGTRVVILESNFRSRPSLIEAVNRVTGPLFRDNRSRFEADGPDASFVLSTDRDSRYVVLPADLMQPAYEPIVPVRSEDKPHRPGLYCFSAIQDNENRLESMARFIVRQVIDWARVFGDPANPGWKHVALLFRTLRTNRLLEPLIRVFHSAGVPFVLERSRHFYEKPEVIDLVNLLTLLINPMDRTALFGVLRAPAFGFSDSFLVRLFLLDATSSEPLPEKLTELWTAVLESGTWERRRNQWQKWAPDLMDEYERLIEWVKWFHQLRARVETMTAPRMVLEVLRRSPLLPYYARYPDGDQRSMNLWKILELAYATAPEAGHDAVAFIEQLRQKVLKRADEPESLLSDPELNACTWMTIHNAKGLEFDVVILVDTEFLVENRSGQHLYESPVRVRVDRHGMLEVSARGGTHLGTVTNIPGVMNRLLQEQVETAEKYRSFYVAMTRAREQLIMVCGCQRRKDDDECRVWKRIPEGGKNFIDFHQIQELRMATPTKLTPADTHPRLRFPRVQLESWERIHTIWRSFLTAPKMIAFPSEEDRLMRTEVDEERIQAPELSWVSLLSPEALEPQRYFARAVGSLVHGLLQRLPLDSGTAIEGEVQWVREVLEQIRKGRLPWWVRAFLEEDKVPDGISGVVDEVESILVKFLASAVWQTIRSRILTREWPFFSVFSSGESRYPQIWEGRVDVIFEDEDGTLIAGDYKTDRVDDPVELSSRYEGQLKVYYEGMRRFFPDRRVAVEIIAVRNPQRIRLFG